MHKLDKLQPLQKHFELTFVNMNYSLFTKSKGSINHLGIIQPYE